MRLRIILPIVALSFLMISTVVFADFYIMDIWAQKPDTSTRLVGECTNSSSAFECDAPYSDCSEVGPYYGNAITYQQLYTYCNGTATQCNAKLNQSTCTSQDGCSWGTNATFTYCLGTNTYNCAALYEDQCNNNYRCTANYGDCTGKPPDRQCYFTGCSAKSCATWNSNQNSCAGVSGCTWFTNSSNGCIGTVASCGSFGVDCTNSQGNVQLGCNTTTNQTVYPTQTGAVQNATVFLNQSGYQMIYNFCAGTAKSCSSLTSQSSCQNQDACSWVPASYACTGTNTFNCGSESQTQCNSDYRCSWDCISYNDETGHCGQSTCDAKPCSTWNSNQGTCTGVSGCSWTVASHVCTGTATSCPSLTNNCVNPEGQTQQGCIWFGCLGGYGSTTVTINPNANVQPSQPAVVTVTISDTRYLANHNVYLNLSIDGIPWDNTDCPISYINLTQPGTCNGDPSCMDWPQGTNSQNNYFSISSTCTIPSDITGTLHFLSVVPTVYSAKTVLNSGSTKFGVGSSLGSVTGNLGGTALNQASIKFTTAQTVDITQIIQGFLNWILSLGY